MRDLVLFVDDQPASISYHREIFELLNPRFETKILSDVDSAVHELRKSLDRVALLVVDVMMGHGQFPAADTADGLRTGISFSFWAQNELNCKAPVILLTNLLAKTIEKEVKSGTQPLTCVAVLNKFDGTPKRLVKEAQTLLTEAEAE